jgi:hypothetical protein
VNAETFNSLHPVGTPVLAYPGCRPVDDPGCEVLITRTRSKAQQAAGGDHVVWVDGHGAYIVLTHVDAVTEEEWEQARVDRDAAIAARRAALLDAIRVRPGDWTLERAEFAVKRAGFGWVGLRTVKADLDALAADGHLTPVTEVVVRYYELTEAAS